MGDNKMGEDIHIKNLTNGWELYKYHFANCFWYRIRNSKDTSAKDFKDYRVHSSGFEDGTVEANKAIDSFVIHYLEDIIRDKEACVFSSSSEYGIQIRIFGAPQKNKR